MSTTTGMPERAEVPREQTWDLEAIFTTPDAWEATYEEVLRRLPEIQSFRGTLSAGPEQIVRFMETAEEISRLAGKVFAYASLSSAADTGDQTAQGWMDQARGMYARLGAAQAFAEPELLAIGFDTLANWMEVHEALRLYAHYFERLQDRQAHVRSGEVEEVFALAQNPLNAPRSIYSSLTNADLVFEPAVDEEGGSHEVGQSTIDGYLSSTDRTLRRSAWTSYADGYLAFKNTLSSTLLGSIKKDVFYARARNYPSSLNASLSPNRIPEAVFYNLIEVFRKHLPLWHRYWALRKKALGYEHLYWYDTAAPLSENPPVVSFEQSVDWIAEGMRPLGGEYTEVLRSGCLEERWVDRAINKGKRAGAFSNGSHDTFPYIMMSYQNNLFSLSTLAHELGHSMHSYYARTTQPFVYSGYSLFVAEVASNFNQALTRAYLFETHPERDFQLSLIDEAMANFRRYFFIMPTLARFELEMHERTARGDAVSADVMIETCARLFSEGFGQDLELDSRRMGITWAQFGHLYANFYVYQYATGIAGAHALAQQVLSDPSGQAAGRYLEFLKAGGSMYPIEALKRAGVDLESPEPVEQAFLTLRQIIDRLETLI